MNAYLFSLNPDASAVAQWDFGFLREFLTGELWKTPDWQGFEISLYDRLPKDDRAIVVIPARHNAGHIDAINRQLGHIDHVVLFLLGDEEADFPVEQLKHPSIHIWVQNAHPGRHDAYHKLGCGYPPQSQEILPKLTPDKTVDVFFSGQNTHSRRSQMFNALARIENTDVTATDGFTRGLPAREYYERMVAAKIAPAPSGAVIPDSFRLFEALESMTFAIADDENSDGTITHYWDWLFGEPTPFYKITNWYNLPGYVENALAGYPANVHKQTAWWINYKRNFAYKVMEQLNA